MTNKGTLLDKWLLLSKAIQDKNLRGSDKTFLHHVLDRYWADKGYAQFSLREASTVLDTGKDKILSSIKHLVELDYIAYIQGDRCISNKYIPKWLDTSSQKKTTSSPSQEPQLISKAPTKETTSSPQKTTPKVGSEATPHLPFKHLFKSSKRINYRSADSENANAKSSSARPVRQPALAPKAKPSATQFSCDSTEEERDRFGIAKANAIKILDAKHASRDWIEERQWEIRKLKSIEEVILYMRHCPEPLSQPPSKLERFKEAAKQFNRGLQFAPKIISLWARYNVKKDREPPTTQYQFNAWVKGYELALNRRESMYWATSR